MQIVIDIPNFAWIEDIKDFKSAVKEYDKGSAFDHAIREALLLGEPLPKNHGRLVDADKLIRDTIKNPVHAPYIHIIDIKDAPTIIEGSDTE